MKIVLWQNLDISFPAIYKLKLISASSPTFLWYIVVWQIYYSQNKYERFRTKTVWWRSTIALARALLGLSHYGWRSSSSSDNSTARKHSNSILNTRSLTLSAEVRKTSPCFSADHINSLVVSNKSTQFTLETNTIADAQIRCDFFGGKFMRVSHIDVTRSFQLQIRCHQNYTPTATPSADHMNEWERTRCIEREKRVFSQQPNKFVEIHSAKFRERG